MHRQLLSLSLLVLWLSGCAGTSTTTTPPANSPTVTGKITVSGTNVDRDGVPWVMHGAQIIAFVAPPAAQTSYFTAAYAHYSTAELQELQAWGANAVRFQVSQPGLDPQNALFNASFLTQIQGAVTYARSIGLNVIVCVQDEAQSGETSPASVPNAATVRVWQELAPLFNADTGIMYEIMNEPNLTPGTANWATWQTAMTSVITAIRATGSQNAVIADGLSYAEILTGAPAPTDPLNQVIYGEHPYFAGTSTELASTWAANWGNFAATEPVMITEWSTTTTSYCDSNTPAAALGLLQYAASLKIGINGYAYDNPGLAGMNYGTLGSIVQDFNGTPTTFLSSSSTCGSVGFGPGKLIQNYYKTGMMATVLQ
jgi:hypothetical protein